MHPYNPRQCIYGKPKLPSAIHGSATLFPAAQADRLHPDGRSHPFPYVGEGCFFICRAKFLGRAADAQDTGRVVRTLPIVPSVYALVHFGSRVTGVWLVVCSVHF